MNKKRFQKVSRAAVASVLAASGAVVALPIENVKATSPFTDVSESHFAYDAIIDLYNRNIISGYGNGKFGPNDSVTRGQAAKMLAQVLGLNTSYVNNPNFKDVKTTDPFYPYIAALANKGVINGFVDQTYRPNEPITRGQMAIILTRGFEFKQATLPLTHTFEDVTANTYERFFIQTIYDLGITKGKTERSFAPYGKVTRGEMAVFINRAENAQAIANPLYEITDVHTMGNITYAYVNGVKHTIDSRLKSIFNDANAAVLEGAIIEGNITDTKRIVSLSNITFTASGSKQRALLFNGNGSEFAGDVAITGSYIKFHNWSVTGEVSIEPETIRTIRAAIEASPYKRVASLGSPFGFIDWGQETDPDDYEPIGGSGGNGNPWTGPADGSEDGSDLVSPPKGSESGYYKTMTPVHRHIEFIDSDIRYLVISQTGTHVSSTKTLPHVTITNKVKAYELYANVGTMYIETDVNTTMYGVSKIEEVYKNSHKSVNLDADTTIDLMVVDNSNGWIDLGEHSYIDKVIIPPNKMPNDIFNDFINDNDLIGNIEDPWGNEVDRDPIENTIVPDLEDPELRIVEIETELDTAEITFNSNEDGMLYYIVKKEKDGEPSIREIIQNTGSRWAGRAAVSAGVDKMIEITQLEDETDYIVYAVVVDEAGNISDKVFEFFQITDAAPPIIAPVKAEALPGGSRIKVEFNPNEAGEYYYHYRALEDDFDEPVTTKKLVEELSLRNNGGSGKVTTPGLNEFTLTGLQPLKEYVIYLVMKDESGNFMAEPVRVTGETTELDNEHPHIPFSSANSTGTPNLEMVDKENYVFEVNVNEALDYESANNVENYILSGTGIVNVTGQQVIRPDYVEYIEGSKKIRIRIPSASGFVDGDTLTVTILPGVKDLAENEFENIETVVAGSYVRNQAMYIHGQTEPPKLTINGYTPYPTLDGGILDFNSDKAGTYYYMILPDTVDMSKVRPRDLYDLITSEEPLREEIKEIFGEKVNDRYDKVKSLAVYGQNGNNPVIVGDQLRNISIIGEKDPFADYILYMVVKDRSGKLSNIDDYLLIDDSRAPQVSGIEIKPIEGSNTSVNISLNSNEAGLLYYKRLEKWVDEVGADGQVVMDPTTGKPMQKLNPEIERLQGWKDSLKADRENLKANPANANIISEIKSWKPQTLAKLSTSFTESDLNPHEEYVYFFAAEDTIGNITVFSAGDAENTYSENLLTGEVYTDGIAPKINPIFKKALKSDFEDGDGNVIVNWGISNQPGDRVIEYVEGKTFKATFSEALTIDSDTTIPKKPEINAVVLEAIKNQIETQTGLGSIKDIEWQDTSTLGTYEERQLVVTFNDVVTTDITIDMTKIVDSNGQMLVTDLAGRTFKKDETLLLTPESFAEYRVPNNGKTNIKIWSADFDPNDPSINGFGPYSAKNVLTQIELTIHNEWNQKLYYVVKNRDNTDLTEEDIDMVIKAIESGDKRTISGINLYGIDQTELVSKMFNFSVKDMPGYTDGDYFLTDQNLFVFTIDQYGNIVLSKDGNDVAKTYKKIEYRR